MLTNVTSLTGLGLKDWLIQRATAIYLAVYTLILIRYLIQHMPLQYVTWHLLFETMAMRIASVLALFAMLLHAWIGLWTVSTDYIKPTSVRLFVQGFIALLLLGQLIWGSMIVWGQ